MGVNSSSMSRSRSKSPPRDRSPPRDSRRSRSRSPPRGNEGGKMTGTAGRWNDRGFGFIKPSDGSEDVFCHFSCITDGNCMEEGSKIEFEKVWDDRKGKYRAEGVTGGTTIDRPSGGGGGGSSQECFDFQKGRCDRGSGCRFSHDGGGGGGGGDRGGGDRYDDRRGGGGGGDRYDDRRGGGD